MYPYRSICLGFLALSAFAQPVIRTFAGGFTGDGGLATQASLYQPTESVVAPDGTVYVVDKINYRVRRITPDGRMTTYIGSGQSGTTANRAPAVQANLQEASGVALDSKGNVYVSDLFSGRVHRIGTDGVLNYFAGNGSTQPATASGVPALSSQIGYPKGLYVDRQDNLFICDRDNHRVYKVTPAGILTTFAGGGSGGDGGQAATASLIRPAGIASDASGQYYITERGGGPEGGGHRIRRVDANGVITTFAGTNGKPGLSAEGGLAIEAQFNLPEGIWAAGADVYVADSNNARIRVIRGGTVTTVAGTTLGFSGDGGLATQAKLLGPQGITADAAGNLYISDTGNARIRVVNRASGTIKTIGGGGDGIGSGDSGLAAGAYLAKPYHLYIDPSGSLLVTDQGAHSIRVIDKNGLISTLAGTTGTFGDAGDNGPASKAVLNGPTGITAGNGNYYFSDTKNHRVRRIDKDGRITTYAGSTPGFSGDGVAATRAQLNLPQGLAFDSAGGDLYIADSANHCVRRVDRAGLITTFAGICGTSGNFDGDALNARFNTPGAVALDGSGSVFVADTGNERIRKVTRGTVTTIAGGGAARNDGGLATKSAVNTPTGIAFDSAGNMFVMQGRDGDCFLRRIDALNRLV